MQGKDENVIFVGSKPTMSYVLAVTTQFSRGSSEVVIKARGRAISHAVDIAEVVRNRFMPETSVKEIKISTETVKDEKGEDKNVSAIAITLAK